VIAALHLEPNDVVVDLGAGTGYFRVRLARALPRGRVLAVDIEPKMLDWILRRAARDHLANISTVLGTASSPGVKGPIDVMLVVNALHHIDHRANYLRPVAPLLAPGGRVVIVDFRSGKLPVGPPDRFKVPPSEATSEMHDAGFSRCGSFDGLPYQYVLSFGLAC
jgi:ubiquinone/menaquinone biosynthesis C-methylase UbiE